MVPGVGLGAPPSPDTRRTNRQQCESHHNEHRVGERGHSGHNVERFEELRVTECRIHENDAVEVGCADRVETPRARVVVEGGRAVVCRAGQTTDLTGVGVCTPTCKGLGAEGHVREAGLRVGVARRRVKSIERSLATLQHGGAEDEQSRVVLNGLIREADANRLVFENLLQSSKKSTILSGTDSIEANTRKISPASVPRDPSFPKPKLIGSLSLVISAFLGIGLAFVIESFDNGFKTPLQLEGALGIPNLAAIPEVQKGERTIRFRTRTLWDYLLLRPMSVFSEGLRTMRSALDMSDMDNPPKLIAVTSSVPDEGKTTTTYCMAVQAADAGLKTLVIDADFRRGALSRQLKKGNKKGLIGVVAGAARLKDVIYTVDKRSGLHFIPSGSRSRIANDIINSPRFGSLLKALKAEYDLVLFDTAPVLLVIDTPILAAQVDKTILLVAWDKTPQNVVESAFKRLRDFNVDLAGTALSLLDVRQQHRYYGDRYYGYGKEYDGYYTN